MKTGIKIKQHQIQLPGMNLCFQKEKIIKDFYLEMAKFTKKL